MNEPLSFQELVDRKDKLVTAARRKAKYEVPLTIRDYDHYVVAISILSEFVSKDINDWGFTDMVIHELKRTNKPVSTSILIFKEMHDGFDPVSAGEKLEKIYPRN